MLFELLILLLTVIIFYYVYSYKKLHRHFKEKGVKFLPGLPFFGNTFRSTFLIKHYLDELQDVYNAFPDERYVGFFEYTKPMILIRDPELMRNITVKDFEHFTDHKEFFNEDSDPLFAGSMLLMKGERWRDMRNTLSPAFTASKMKLMFPFLLETANNIVEHLNENQKQDIDVDDLMRRYTNDVIATAGFGLQVNSVKDRDNEFYAIGSILSDFNFRLILLMVMNTLWPSLAKKIGMRLFPDKVYKFFTNIVASTMEFRKKENVARPDMIQLLMEAKREWTPADLTGQVFIFFSAGFETSATALVMTIHELAINPAAQDKLYQECRTFKEEKQLTFDNLFELKYLDCVINESMRKWCPAIFLDRLCTKTYQLPPPREGGQPYLMKPGEDLYNLVNQVQLDPKYWPDPHKYDPDRFSDEYKHNIKPFTFMPFGVGPRACIGMRFAMMTLKVLIYNLIVNFKIVQTAKTHCPIKMKPMTFTVRAEGGTNVQFEKRLSN